MSAGRHGPSRLALQPRRPDRSVRTCAPRTAPGARPCRRASIAAGRSSRPRDCRCDTQQRAVPERRRTAAASVSCGCSDQRAAAAGPGQIEAVGCSRRGSAFVSPVPVARRLPALQSRARSACPRTTRRRIPALAHRWRRRPGRRRGARRHPRRWPACPGVAIVSPSTSRRRSPALPSRVGPTAPVHRRRRPATRLVIGGPEQPPPPHGRASDPMPPALSGTPTARPRRPGPSAAPGPPADAGRSPASYTVKAGRHRQVHRQQVRH